jgi:predicted ferric reductase
MALANTALLVLFAMRNTPFAFLSAWSYERLNFLHRVVGYMTLAQVAVHLSLYSIYFCHVAHTCERLSVLTVVYGEVAGGCFLMVVVAGVVVRRWWYEAFYYMHISFWIAALVFTGLHQPSPQKSAWKIVALCAGLWVLDRIARLVRIVVAGINNSATVWPLPNGGTRIVFKKGPPMASAGQHAFVWIPRIRLFESHPFTIAALDETEFVVASYDGFTKSLHDYAVRHPGAELRASLDGPYGALPDMGVFDRVVLIAGGSGASFTIGRALHMLSRVASKNDKREQRLLFVWCVRHNCELPWSVCLKTLGCH